MTVSPGDPDATTSAALTVTGVVEDGIQTVVVGPGDPNRRSELRRELKAAYRHGGIRDMLIVAGSPEFSPMSDKALDRLMACDEIRRSNDETITPLAAERFGTAVVDASAEAKRCDNHCGRVVEGNTSMCNECDDRWSASERLTVDYYPSRGA